MANRILLSALAAFATVAANAADFGAALCDTTLRLDYVVTGGASSPCALGLSRAYKIDGWAGRRVNLDRVPYEADGVFTLTDAQSGDTLYRTAFSTLFHEWLTTDEASTTQRSMTHTILSPMPRRKAVASLEFRDYRGQTLATTSHPVDPADILIRPIGKSPKRTVDLHIGGTVDRAIDIAIIGEGYTEAETDTFIAQATGATAALLRHEPFGSMASRLNVRAVITPSPESGVSVPRLNEWVDTPFGSHFSTFYSTRYLTSPDPTAIHDALAGVPYEHIIVLANTEEYGGGGIFNAYTLTAGGHPTMEPVVVHEFGHSFGGLADEYFYEHEQSDDYFPRDLEPWNPNLTTLVDFDSKWKSQLPDGVPVPTPVKKAAKYPLGVYEGGGYCFKGVYRPADRCRMRDNAYPTFCPACIAALRRLIDFYTLSI